MARKVVAVVLLGLLACAALASAQDTADQNKDATKDAEKHLDNEHEKEDYNKYMQDKHDYKPHKHHKDTYEKEYEPKEHNTKAPKHYKPSHDEPEHDDEPESYEHKPKHYKPKHSKPEHYEPEEHEEEYEPKPKHYKPKHAYKPKHDEPEYHEPEEPHMDLPHKLVKVPHMAKEMEFDLDVTKFSGMPQDPSYKVGSNWASKFELSYKGKTVGEATLTGVIVSAEKGVVAVNAELIIKSAGDSEEAMVAAAGLVVIKLTVENKFAGFENGGPEFVITGGTGAMAGVDGTVAFAVKVEEGTPKTTATFDITLPKQKPEKKEKDTEE